MQRRKHDRPTIGVLAGWQVYGGTIPESFLAAVLQGVRSAARERGCNLMLACGIGPSSGAVSLQPAWPVPSPGCDFVPVGPWNADGLLVIAPLIFADKARYVQDLFAAGYPVVLAGEGEGCPAVTTDNEEGVRLAVGHLIAHGHQRIAFIASGPEEDRGFVDSGTYRLRAYYAALEENGLAVDRQLVAYGFHSGAGGRSAMRQLLDSGAAFTAVLASNDASAIGAMQTLHEAGLNIPRDIAIVGFDDLAQAVTRVPPLTTVRYPKFEIGALALDLLLEYVAGRARDVRTIKAAPRLVVRQSCGCEPDMLRPATLARQESASGGPVAATPRLAEGMAGAVLNEARRLNLEELVAMCEFLVDGLVTALQEDDAAPFLAALGQVLRRVEAVGDDLHVWQTALSALEDGCIRPPGAWPWRMGQRQAEDVLRQARIAVSGSAQRRYEQYVEAENWTTDQVGLLMARLLTALEEEQIFSVLAEHLPEIGSQRIERIHVAFFEPEGDDPVAWSVMRSVPGASATRFPTRQFPPPDLYPPEQCFTLALLPLVVQEGVSGFVAFDADSLKLCGDITRQLAAAFRSARMYRAAVEGRRLAEEANRLKSRFLSTVSHELRTPLNLVVGLTQMLLEEPDGPFPERGREDLERIYTAAQHLDSLIRDVLDLARSEAGQLLLTCEPLNLIEALQPVAAVGEQMARDKGLGWTFDAPADLPLVWADRTRLRQVTLNLVSNAIKFTTHGEVVLRVANCKQSAICVSVRDTGLGIPPEEQALIFDEFRQSERTAARGYGGLGLGLAICKRLVELHGGRIGVRSEGEQTGSTFTFSLPAIEPPATVVETLPAGERTVLLLSERTETSDRLREHLVRQGFEIEELGVGDGFEWLWRLTAAPPGAVVLGLEPASARGWEVLKALKSHPATRDIPVLFYSLAEEMDSGAVLEMDYLIKPVGMMDLVRALGRQGDWLAQADRTVLIADDDPAVLEMHARVIRSQWPACRVLRALNGREALEVIQQNRPDVVLLDLMMPELDGFGVLEAMRLELATRDIPVVVLTGQALTGEDMARLNRGVASVLGKGLFTVEETLAHVEAALTRQQRVGNETQRLIRKIMAYLHEHYAEPISREDVASHVGLSANYVSDCFHKETGVTLVTYLNRYRVRRARELLAAGGKSVTEVAMEVGFSNSSHFSQVFRREVGASPSEYRQSRLGEAEASE